MPALLRENMEFYFAMGGAAYLDTYQAVSAESGLGLDDAVWDLSSLLQDFAEEENRYHLETVRHSREELEHILARGGKLDHTQYTVDEEEEYEQAHGFSMGM